ncbi:TetR family transcriptional regulator [Bordetella ansorpii]|uniref:TetR family transcriptional regulator n=1 Tax=Bordetella ansorpii TaxID=288768 RepID=A0A157STN3_9BORD|nr:TetR/AcrR family transcriptional regulator [Bordetella ansorpii]SAI73777.1 TetR family transcriptional regulator [Bordetella ansorpii]
MKPDASLSDSQIRLLDATEQLVYADGIRATGMDSIVKTSGVARKSIYRHYANKDELVAAALRRRDERWMQWFIDETSSPADPMDRLLSMFPALQRWFESPGFHGCAFINAAGEIGDAGHPIRVVSRLHKQRLYDYVRELAGGCMLADPDDVARQLLVLIDGAIAVALVMGDPSCAASAGRAARTLLASAASRTC